jgi:RNA polymerase sigma factor (sigma-70 family)
MNDNHLDQLEKYEWDKLINSIIKPYIFICYSVPHISVEDLQQEAWYGLLQACQTYDESRGKLSTYAYKFILGSVRRHVAKHTKIKLSNIDNELIVPDSHNTESEIDGHELYELILERAGSELSANMLIDRFINEMSLREMAKKYGLSHQMIKNKLSQLLDLLKARIQH